MDPTSLQLLSAAQNEQNYDGVLAISTFNSSPYIRVYAFTHASGFGAQYSNPSTYSYNGSITPGGLKFNEPGDVLLYTHDGSSATTTLNKIGLNLYNWSNQSGFGTKLLFNTSYSPRGKAGAITTILSEYGAGWSYVLTSYVDVNGDSWIHRSHFANNNNITYCNQRPTYMPNNAYNSIAFNKQRTYVLAVNQLVSLAMFPWTDGWENSSNYSSNNLGTPITNSNLGYGWNCGTWHPSDTVVVVGKAGSGQAAISAMVFAGNWQSVLSDAINPMSDVQSVRFSASGKTLFVTSLNSPYLEAYPFDLTTGFGSKYSNPSSLPPGPCYDLAVSKTNDLVAVSSSSSPYLAVYAWDDDTGFGAKYASGSAPGDSRALAFN